MASAFTYILLPFFLAGRTRSPVQQAVCQAQKEDTWTQANDSTTNVLGADHKTANVSWSGLVVRLYQAGKWTDTGSSTLALPSLQQL